ncbi:MAG: RsmB/NOP family class I SAM-dependent RNA methyltransferase [Rhodospirillaceae bacterium]|nr:RsmB/NOP family class I SAM-dependent RNA methyltransferase [Rhodospirillaceae bacterium]
MTPGARIAAAIEILEKVERSNSPADDVVSSYLRGRRYIGSKDRRAITGRVFDVLRRLARLDWHIGESSPRRRVIADLKLNDAQPDDAISALFDGEGYAPSALTGNETALLDKLKDKSFDEADYPAAVAAELPDWLAEILTAQWGDKFLAEAQALNQPASLDLRVNTLKGDCTRALQVLQKDKIEAEPTTYSPLGLRLKGRVNLQASTAFKGGFIEIQDEGSQIIALLVDTKADMKTIDLCAGGGGKTLALGAAMKDGGPLIACDLDEDRLKKIKPRLRRGGVSNVTRHHITGDDDPFYAEHAATAERVLADVPCSGSGAWRRAPAQKWRLTPERLEDLVTLQQKIMTQAAELMIPGGRLIYATCSVLPAENENQITWFMENHPDFKVLPVSEIWQAAIGTDYPENFYGETPYLSLTPARHDTDGFFAAVLEKKHS